MVPWKKTLACHTYINQKRKKVKQSDKLGPRWNAIITRPDFKFEAILDSSAQTTLGKVLVFFRKISKRARYVVFKKRCFPEVFLAQNRPFGLKLMF